MIRLDIWLTDARGNRLRVAEAAFAAADSHGRYESALRYTPDWLAHPARFALDPANLPLDAREYTAARLGPPLMALDDALPDLWGRRLLVLQHALPRGSQAEPHLLRALAGRGLGALAFLAPGQAPPASDAGGVADALHLDELAREAQRLDAGEMVDERSRLLLAAGSSPGGARPKALIRTADGDWLAKFASRRDVFDEIGLEATGLALAHRAGLCVPDFRLAALGDRQRALLVCRFDLDPRGGRRHMLSFRALLGASGHYVLGYADMLDALRRHGARPEVEVPALFRQMVFNALLGNTDDHLKNFWLLNAGEGYVLTPAFDLLPDVGANREHVLRFDLDNSAPPPAALATLGRRWGVSGAVRIVDEVVAAMAHFSVEAAAHGVPAAQIAHFERDIARRVAGSH